MRHYAHTYFGYLLIILNTPLLLLPSGFAMQITFHFTNILNHVSLLPMSHAIMNESPPTLCSPITQISLGIILCKSMSMELLLIVISPMDVLISDKAHAATSQKVTDILHMYCIKSCTGEPHHQHQNYTECCIGHIKHVTNHVLTFTGAPNNLW